MITSGYLFDPEDITVSVCDVISSEYPIWITIQPPGRFGVSAVVRLTPELADKLLSQLAACIAMHEEATGETHVLTQMLGRIMPLLKEEVKEDERGQAGD